MSLNKIKEKILTNAQEQANNIKREAKEKADNIKKEAEQKIEKYFNEKLNQLNHEIQLYLKSNISAFKLLKNKEYLDKRENLINHILEKSLESFRKSKKYSNYLSKLIKENLKEKSTIYCNSSDLKKLKTIIKSNKKVIALKTLDIQGGLLFETQKGKRINLTLDENINQNLSEIRKEIISYLEK